MEASDENEATEPVIYEQVKLEPCTFSIDIIGILDEVVGIYFAAQRYWKRERSKRKKIPQIFGRRISGM